MYFLFLMYLFVLLLKPCRIVSKIVRISTDYILLDLFEYLVFLVYFIFICMYMFSGNW
jgi:hypothetical protein